MSLEAFYKDVFGNRVDFFPWITEVKKYSSKNLNHDLLSYSIFLTKMLGDESLLLCRAWEPDYSHAFEGFWKYTPFVSSFASF